MYCSRVHSKIRAPLCAACTLNATGQNRGHSIAAVRELLKEQPVGCGRRKGGQLQPTTRTWQPVAMVTFCGMPVVMFTFFYHMARGLTFETLRPAALQRDGRWLRTKTMSSASWMRHVPPPARASCLVLPTIVNPLRHPLCYEYTSTSLATFLCRAFACGKTTTNNRVDAAVIHGLLILAACSPTSRQPWPCPPRADSQKYALATQGTGITSHQHPMLDYYRDLFHRRKAEAMADESDLGASVGQPVRPGGHRGHITRSPVHAGPGGFLRLRLCLRSLQSPHHRATHAWFLTVFTGT